MVEGFRTAFHKTSNNLPEADVHLLFDEYDAVEVIGH
jgi:hypothetical protein